MIRGLSCLALIALLSACSADRVNYPSLARRDAERIADTASPAPAPQASPAAPASPETMARLSALVGQAREAHRGFMGKRARAEALVGAASGAAIASESWSVATVALADLEAARSQAMVALADLDQLYAAERIAGGPAVETGAAREEVTGMIGEEDRVLRTLRGRLK